MCSALTRQIQCTKLIAGHFQYRESVVCVRIAALDIGGTAIKCGIWDGARMAAVREHPSAAREGGPVLMDQAKAILSGMLPFDAIGISTSGEVDIHTGRICSANGNIPGYLGMPVANILQGAFNVPVVVENDANAAALGELYYGCMRGESNFVYVTYGTGVGGAVIMNGELYFGKAFSAGSFGGMVVHPEQLDAGNLLAGRYESFASTSALVRRMQRINPRLDNGRKIFEETESPVVLAEINAWIHEIAIGLVTLVYAFSPPALVLGGGVMEQPHLVDSIEAEVKRLAEPRFNGIRIMRAKLGNIAGVLGVSHLAQQLIER